MWPSKGETGNNKGLWMRRPLGARRQGVLFALPLWLAVNDFLLEVSVSLDMTRCNNVQRTTG